MRKEEVPLTDPHKLANFQLKALSFQLSSMSATSGVSETIDRPIESIGPKVTLLTSESRSSSVETGSGSGRVSPDVSEDTKVKRTRTFSGSHAENHVLRTANRVSCGFCIFCNLHRPFRYTIEATLLRVLIDARKNKRYLACLLNCMSYQEISKERHKIAPASPAPGISLTFSVISITQISSFNLFILIPKFTYLYPIFTCTR